ncbi:helix-turn-helix transcriptional regulator [Rhodobacteraceae bacterium NNCM2]|nr:helix-turn-helix transcriptional regulator [Coraliihabitans acroporae]
MTPAQCRAARALIGMEQRELAKQSGLAVSTVIDFEKEIRAPRSATVSGLRATLEAAGVEFIEENGGGPGVRLRK